MSSITNDLKRIAASMVDPTNAEDVDLLILTDALEEAGWVSIAQFWRESVKQPMLKPFNCLTAKAILEGDLKEIHKLELHCKRFIENFAIEAGTHKEYTDDAIARLLYTSPHD